MKSLKHQTKKHNRLIYYLCLFNLIFVTFACQQKGSGNLLLSTADSLMSTRPDSALYLLENICLSEIKTPAQKAKYILLLTQAQDKNYITPTTDSLIRIATEYYDSINNDIAMQAKTHYYLGRVYQELGNNPATIREFLKAMPLVKQSKDHKLLCMLYGNLGYVYFQQDLLDKADSLYVCEEELLKQEADSAHLATLLVQRAGICIMKGHAFHAEAEEFLNQALSIAEKLNNTYVEIEVLGVLRCLYNDMGEPKKAISYIRRELMLQKDTAQLYGIYLSLGDAYRRSNKNDSAVYYAYKSLASPSFYTKANACTILEDVARKKGDFAEAIHFKDNYEAYMDSTKQLEHTKEILSAEEETLLQQSEQKHRSNISLYFYYIYTGISFIIIFTVFFAYKRIKYRQKTQQLKQKQDSLLQTISAQSIQMKKEVENKDAELEELRQKCNRYNGDKQKLDQLNSCLNELLEEKNRICTKLENAITNKEKEIELLTQQIQSSDETRHNIHLAEQLTNIKKEKNYLFDSLLTSRSVAYKTLITIKQHNYENPDENKKIPTEIWETLLYEIDQLTHGFIKGLMGKYERLSKEDVYFCCLVKIGMKYADIAYVFGCTSNAVYKRRDAILKRMDVETKVKFEILIEEIQS
ncbi:lipopolysaccharide assembly protein LapB [Bacteroides sp. GM023]|uniref:tetratricopeptide repeat protein n=1 Tax=Bacteroides sp. GM023 TaxID=2723058 RepID=UPI00168BC13C|nr:tetratricopeptide repeat protein [Bacteroides sp. GM023]MBD3590989.1 hypothetical protein [Bacteroides sp. GM023]